MSKHRFMTLATVFVVAFVALGVHAQVSATSDVAAAVRLTVDQTSFTASQGVVIHVTITNPTDRPIKVLKWYTPADEVEEPLFTVTRDGAPVPYFGAYYKRPAPSSGDYITLKSRASLTRDVDLSAFYDLSTTGRYTIRYDVAALNLYSEKEDGLKRVERMASDNVELWIEGRRAKTLGDAVTPYTVTGSTSFNRCTTTQQSSLLTARTEASNYSANALGYLQAGNQGPRYVTWFGVYNSGRYSTVTSHFGSISSAMDTASVTFDCGCKKKYYAYVYPNQPYTIYLCSVFWTAPMTGTDSKAGTLIHEMSHFYVVASTEDYVYGQTNAKALAISDPSKAINNADNHEYFAENNPYQN